MFKFVQVMRRSSWLLLISITFWGITACEKDGIDKDVDKTDLYDSWNILSQKRVVLDSATENPIATQNSNYNAGDFIYTFNPNGKLIVKDKTSGTLETDTLYFEYEQNILRFSIFQNMVDAREYELMSLNNTELIYGIDKWENGLRITEEIRASRR